VIQILYWGCSLGVVGPLGEATVIRGDGPNQHAPRMPLMARRWTREPKETTRSFRMIATKIAFPFGSCKPVRSQQHNRPSVDGGRPQPLCFATLSWKWLGPNKEIRRGAEGNWLN
jgi:hypothetical protein